MNLKTILFSLILISAFSLQGQVNYYNSRYAVDSALNLDYGSDTNYAGNVVDLKFDLYKPINDSNCLRPVMILVHGGAWVGGSKEDPNMAYMAMELARKGWVVANMNYRLGTHKAANYDMYAVCNTTISQPCGYICDSAEVYRANFRGMQDAKGLIRYMKSRHILDSTDINNVFIAGESAGGFIALATAFTNRSSEKHTSCYSIAAAPAPDTNLYSYSCIPSNNQRSRPDLGSIEGKLHLGSYDSRVQGVANFYGGLLDTIIISTEDTGTWAYLFHQGADIVVNYKYGPILGRTSWECYQQSNICQPYYFYPYAYGSLGISNWFLKSNMVRHFGVSIVSNYSYLNNCFSNGHSIDNVALRTNDMVLRFSPKIKLSGNDPKVNCAIMGLKDLNSKGTLKVFPNPAQGATLSVEGTIRGQAYSIVNSLGQVIRKGIFSGDIETLSILGLPSGVYTILSSGGYRAVFVIGND